MKCKKCGESLHPEQKACLACGTQTELWPGGIKPEEKPPLEIPWTPVAIIGGGLVLLIVLIIVGLSMRVVPPDKVTKNWVEACISRDIKNAKNYTTERFESSVSDRSASAEKSDMYFEFLYNNKGGYTVEKPQYPQQGLSLVTVKFTGGNGQSLISLVQLVRQAKAWKIDHVAP